ncbi:hypothetical protein G3A39_43145, partial [Paraburkholderia aspalathi]|nr:hypothetical protein [Paraburkholderia aspalathi]
MNFKAIALTVLASTAFASITQAQTIVRFAHMNSPEHFVHLSAVKLAEAVSKRTSGEVVIELFPSGQLGENGQVVEQISFGSDLM